MYTVYLETANNNSCNRKLYILITSSGDGRMRMERESRMRFILDKIRIWVVVVAFIDKSTSMPLMKTRSKKAVQLAAIL